MVDEYPPVLLVAMRNVAGGDPQGGELDKALAAQFSRDPAKFITRMEEQEKAWGMQRSKAVPVVQEKVAEAVKEVLPDRMECLPLAFMRRCLVRRVEVEAFLDERGW
jgi:hypothetical protein